MRRRNRIKQYNKQRRQRLSVSFDSFEFINWKQYMNRKTAGWLVLAILVIVQVFFTIQTSAMGAELSLYEHKSIELTKENQELKTALVSQSSLSETQEKAEELGYVRPSTIVFVKENAPVTALR
jgi:hypothetical protein